MKASEIKGFEAFIKDVQSKVDRYHMDRNFHDFMKTTIGYTVGRKYVRVFKESCNSKSVYCFVDEHGNLYKANSWKSPANGIRSTLKDVADRGGIADTEIHSFGCIR